MIPWLVLAPSALASEPAPSALAVAVDQKAPPPKKGGKGGKGGPVTVPIDIGIGPATHFVSGPVYREQAVVTGLEFSAEAVIDHATIKKYKNRIPAQYRKLALSMDEVRISHPLIPHTIFLSPEGVAGATVGMYGLSLRPVSLGLPLLSGKGLKADLDLGLRLTFAYVHSATIPSPTYFLRPGLDPKLEAEVPFSKDFLISFGWCSQLYVPQAVGGGIFEVGPLDEAMWHLGQGFVKLHFRFPYRLK